MGFAPCSLTVRSHAFQAGGPIPARHTGEGVDVSPALTWQDLPSATRSVALFCHDPDAPLAKPGSYGFTHWVLYNLPASTVMLAEGSREGTCGRNDFGNNRYNGPLPPPGHGRHHYYFWVVALDAVVDLPPGLTLEQFLSRTEPHITGMDRLIGTYQRG
jgi:Raf kinase inhibitor-like YbhB/YbcL family protein